ncbi:4-hydroxyphenylpyruvate dioxygenase [Oscillatoria sp. FACHB-1407]|uniref:4-hydroxyphenylpyruvate dioxygenase n=1 Tax=Oscillatoria sp. FACHB-1407 TaxID=2692847 RepID=UPI0016889627|nr:4-hydroxyphenylpyruvate dioxygenase [Oscillatoria sp. FACHB-1407]MBD2463296.1 4-hydroxyphenylpyruvate dioxygenase [Oscillatoria sp. FACHB-1407]
MDIDHVHFYVEDAIAWRDWFVQRLGFQATAITSTLHTQTVIAYSGAVQCVLSSPLTSDSPVADYLERHPAGVSDIALRVRSIDRVLERAIAQGARVLQSWQDHPAQWIGLLHPQGKWFQIQGWGDLTHTLIESSAVPSYLTWSRLQHPTKLQQCAEAACAPFVAIDHAVLNVASGQLEQAANWYEAVLGFERRQTFAIQTNYSGLCSQVLVHPEGTAQLPVNESASPSSQIQEFLDHNRGSGIQHVALKTIDIVETIAHLRQQGIPFLSVPPTYYEQLRQRPGFQLTETQWQAIAAQEVLVDWQPHNPDAMLLQAFTRPIFGQPTFFFELIQRQHYVVEHQRKTAEGFGEGNFRALFEAIEREQMNRGSLK